MTTVTGDRLPSVNILGIRFHNVTRDQTVEIIEDMIAAGDPCMICTPNADHIIRAQRDKEFQQIISNSDLVVSDGMAVVYASRFLGMPLKQNVGGRLLLPAMAELSARKGYRIFLLGGSSQSVAEQAAEQLCRTYAGVSIVGIYAPPYMVEFDAMETGRMLQQVNQSKPDVLFVCLGTPKQEKWIARNLERLDVPVSIGVGAALDLLAGKVRMPPKWATEIGLEWLCRVVQEPRRLGKRYFVDDPIFVWWVLLQRLKLRNYGSAERQ